ncbi:hypothetical protein QUB56_07590 [Microcoleus sp. AR_TQ3_B6]|uniref:hypothetical protein n=1 Tax=Microcoleus sp. AR_TQ3_B6 TaxID=3055284 RepID=UPI002FD3B0FB
MSVRPNFAQALTIETKISSPYTANNIAGFGDAPIIVASMDAAKAASQIATKSDRGGTDNSRAIAHKSKRCCPTEAVASRGV